MTALAWIAAYAAGMVLGGLAMAVDWVRDGEKDTEIAGRATAVLLWPVMLVVLCPIGVVTAFGAFGRWYVKRQKAKAEALEAKRAYKSPPDPKDYRGTEVK